MRRLVFSLCLLLNIHGLKAQQPDLAAADEFGARPPFKVQNRQELDSLVRIIDTRFSHPVEKVRAMFKWVATTLEYDCGNDSPYPLRAITVDQVLRMGKSQCAGYSNLLQYGLTRLGFENTTIRGVAKTAKKDLWWTEKDLRPNHSWNAVKMNGEWKLLDATWASGASNDDCSVVNREFAPYYFFPPPETFRLSHLPADSSWQLMDMPMSAQLFASLPVFHDPYYESGVENFSPSAGVLQLRINDPVTFSFTGPKPIEHIAVWSEENKAVKPEFGSFIKKGNVYSYTYRIKNTGSYFLNVSLDGRRTAMVYYVNVAM